MDEKYKNALAKAREIYRKTNVVQKGLLESLFPELSESEDEKIRKALIRFHKSTIDIDGIKGSEIVSWLEKQESVDRDKLSKGVLRGVANSIIQWIDANVAEGNMCLSNMECENIENSVVNLDWTKVYNYMKKKLEKPQGKTALEAINEETE